MRRLKTRIFQFDGHQCVELAVEEKQVYELFFIANHYSILILQEHEILPETEDKVSNIPHNLFVEDCFVPVFLLGIKVFRIDKIKQVFLLKGLHRAHRQTLVGNGFMEIVGQMTAVLVKIVVQIVTQNILVPTMLGTLMDIECTAFY